jgi:hypothetical protein
MCAGSLAPPKRCNRGALGAKPFPAGSGNLSRDECRCFPVILLLKRLTGPRATAEDTEKTTVFHYSNVKDGTVVAGCGKSDAWSNVTL